MSTLQTQRLRLEPFTDDHLESLFRLNSDPDVMRYISGKPETREETVAMIERIKARWIEFGFSWWSFIELETNEIIGAGCIQYLGRDPANPLEIGWRLRPDKWRQGYASEAAYKMTCFAFDQIGTDTLIAVCQQENTSSAAVMKKLGMEYRGIERWYDMDTAVYVMTRANWEAQRSNTLPTAVD